MSVVLPTQLTVNLSKDILEMARIQVAGMVGDRTKALLVIGGQPLILMLAM